MSGDGPPLLSHGEVCAHVAWGPVVAKGGEGWGQGCRRESPACLGASSQQEESRPGPHLYWNGSRGHEQRGESSPLPPGKKRAVLGPVSRDEARSLQGLVGDCGELLVLWSPRTGPRVSALFTRPPCRSSPWGALPCLPVSPCPPRPVPVSDHP